MFVAETLVLLKSSISIVVSL